jgi:hypothetical protein
MLSSAGLSDSIDSAFESDAVTKYIKQCRKKRERAKELAPICLNIARREVLRLQWNDECFEQFVIKMFRGADVSQLENFYSRYKRVTNKKLFFLNFVRNEL